MTEQEEWAEIDAQLQAQGFRPCNTVRKVRIVELVFHGAVLSKKNRHIISRQGSVIPDAKARANENDIIQQLTDELRNQGITDIFSMTKAEQVMQAKKKHTKYSIRFWVWRANEIRRDLDNQLNTLLDAMTASFAIADDSCKFVKQILIVDRGVDREDPRVEIRLRITEDAEE